MSRRQSVQRHLLHTDLHDPVCERQLRRHMSSSGRLGLQQRHAVYTELYISKCLRTRWMRRRLPWLQRCRPDVLRWILLHAQLPERFLARRRKRWLRRRVRMPDVHLTRGRRDTVLLSV